MNINLEQEEELNDNSTLDSSDNSSDSDETKSSSLTARIMQNKWLIGGVLLIVFIIATAVYYNSGSNDEQHEGDTGVDNSENYRQNVKKTGDKTVVNAANKSMSAQAQDWVYDAATTIGSYTVLSPSYGNSVSMIVVTLLMLTFSYFTTPLAAEAFQFVKDRLIAAKPAEKGFMAHLQWFVVVFVITYFAVFLRKTFDVVEDGHSVDGGNNRK